jgi:hypothetical protein
VPEKVTAIGLGFHCHIFCDIVADDLRVIGPLLYEAERERHRDLHRIEPLLDADGLMSLNLSRVCDLFDTQTHLANIMPIIPCTLTLYGRWGNPQTLP